MLHTNVGVKPYPKNTKNWFIESMKCLLRRLGHSRPSFCFLLFPLSCNTSLFLFPMQGIFPFLFSFFCSLNRPLPLPFHDLSILFLLAFQVSVCLCPALGFFLMCFPCHCHRSRIDTCATLGGLDSTLFSRSLSLCCQNLGFRSSRKFGPVGLRLLHLFSFLQSHCHGLQPSTVRMQIPSEGKPHAWRWSCDSGRDKPLLFVLFALSQGEGRPQWLLLNIVAIATPLPTKG
mmetsp:Transcript_46726/g.141595  ORF Transcript_46726/g.141595 Transcript_46726/m.141595 type:complete len:231 (+) Transcript_46726:509-1201(+)